MKQMITAAQLRAARGLLDWTRSELAKASGLSAETIKNIEHGVYAPQNRHPAIIHACAAHSVEFTETTASEKVQELSSTMKARLILKNMPMTSIVF